MKNISLPRYLSRSVIIVLMTSAFISLSAQQEQINKDFKPQSGQPGKDVVWVPTPQVLVEKMLDLAKVTSKDFLIDLG